MIAVDPFAEYVVITVVEFPDQCRRLLPVFVFSERERALIGWAQSPGGPIS
jgi:hypothetical protein